MNKARDLSKKVKNYALDKVGFDLVGIASAFDPQFDRAPKGHHPDEWLPGAKSVITGGIKVLREILETTPSTLYAFLHRVPENLHPQNISVESNRSFHVTDGKC
mgnify:CR=1 FL=1